MENFKKTDTYLILKTNILEMLKNEIYLPALICALTIPDIFGIAEFPELDGSKKGDVCKRYSRWFDQNVRNSMGLLYSDEFYSKASPKMDGKVCYQLRCKLLHEGTDDLEKNTGIDEFVLVFNKEQFVRGNYAGIEPLFNTYNFETGEFKYNNYLYVSVVELCLGIINGADNYRKLHKDKKYSEIRFNCGGGKIPKDLFIDIKKTTENN